MQQPTHRSELKELRPGGASLTTGDAARHLSVSPNTIKRWIAAGAMRAYTTPGGHWRIPLESFERFLSERGLPSVAVLAPAASGER